MEDIRKLGVGERVRLVQEIWDSIHPTAEELPLTEEQKQLLDERLEEHRQDPSSAVSWKQLKARLESE